jgi:hypothetical protein
MDNQHDDGMRRGPSGLSSFGWGKVPRRVAA